MFYLKFTITTARTHNKVLYASMAGHCMASFVRYSTVVQILVGSFSNSIQHKAGAVARYLTTAFNASICLANSKTILSILSFSAVYKAPEIISLSIRGLSHIF